MMMSTLAAAVPLPLERLGSRRDVKAEARELRELREGFGLTQSQMAQLLDISHNTYYRWESGKATFPLMALELMRCWAREERSTKATKRK
jgi:DNA-binding transcriptional regulator YiaG